MFDYIRCEMPLPETPVPPRTEGDGRFQTKDTPDQYMTTYTIKADGGLYWHPYEMVETPQEQKPYPYAKKGDIRYWAGCMTRKEADEQRLSDFHGDIDFYASDWVNEEQRSRGWWEYRARFTNGTCAKIDLIEFRADGHEPLPTAKPQGPLNG